MGEGVHRAGPQPRLGQAGHRPEIGDHQVGAHERGDAVLGARRQAVDPGHLRARERRRDRRHRGAGDGGDRLGGVDHAAAAEGDEARRAGGRVEQRRRDVRHLARGHLVHRVGGGDRGRGFRRAARSVRAATKESKPCSASSSGTSSGGPSPKRTVRPASRQTNGPLGRGHVLRGLTTGRRFGSTSGRMCSKSGGSESFSPRCSSGSSTVKPGPSVAISKRTPLGSRK